MYGAGNLGSAPGVKCRKCVFVGSVDFICVVYLCVRVYVFNMWNVSYLCVCVCVCVCQT